MKILFISFLIFSGMISTQTNTTTLLHYLVKEPKVKSAKNPVIILLHGVGSNEEDLFGLASHLPDNFRVISARAPITLGSGSYAWYQVDFSTGKPVYNQAQEQKSRETIITFIEEIKEKYKLESEQVYIGGFSQGGIMTYSVGLTKPELVAGIVVMSGRLLEEIKPNIASKEKLKNLAVFMSHGTKDNVLPVQYAREAKHFLQTLDMAPAYKEYAEGHGINQQMLVDLKAWLGNH